MNPGTLTDEATLLIAALRDNLFTKLGTALTTTSLTAALAVPKTHKAHPLVHLVRAASKVRSTTELQVLANLDAAIGACHRDVSGDAHRWACAQVESAAHETELANASSLLAEVRAFGTLWNAGLDVKSARKSRVQKTYDFDVMLGSSAFAVEVHCKQMNTPQANSLAAFSATGDPGTRVIYPAGAPKNKETTAENVASKFAQIKPRGGQASVQKPTVLWLDLQDEDWWGLMPSHAEPFSVSQQLYFSGGLWHAFYGRVSTPMFEYHTTDELAFTGVPAMQHPGLFEQSKNWAGAILSFPKGTAFFENPDAPMPVDDHIRAAICKLSWFDVQRSRMSWPPNSDTVADRLSRDRADLSELARVAIYHL